MTQTHWFHWIYKACALVALCVMSACSGCVQNSGPCGTLCVSPSGDILVSSEFVTFARTNVGARESSALTITNVSPDGPLLITSMALIDAASGASREGLSVEGIPAHDASDPFVLEPQGSLELDVVFAPRVASAQSAIFRITSSDPERPTVDVEVTTLGNPPQLVALPPQLSFPRIPEGSSLDGTVIVRNEGNSPLEIHDLALDGSQDYRPVDWPTRFPVVLDPLPEVLDGLSDAELTRFELPLKVRYRAIGQDADAADIVIESNDVDEPIAGRPDRGITRIPVVADADAPCIFVASTAINFQQVPLATTRARDVRVENCGKQQLDVSTIRLTRNSLDREFGLDLLGLDRDGDGLLDRTLTIAPGASASFVLRYEPLSESTATGEVVIASSDPARPELTLTLRGRGYDGPCPVAQAGGFIEGMASTARQQVAAIPLQTLILDGSRSTSTAGIDTRDPLSYQWTVLEAPRNYPGVSRAIRPLDSAPDDYSRQKIELLLAGTYRFRLDVVDRQGVPSCDGSIVEVSVQSAEKILIELTWANPEDPNELDGDGADVDLHLVKMGPGTWFNPLYDTFFGNPGPTWAPETPSLDIDDRDGGGPENIQLDDPRACEWYAVGVHYYDQRFGTAYATVRIYIDARLVFEEINVPLERTDAFWDVARIHWDSGRVLSVNQVSALTPRFIEPDVIDALDNPTDNMVDSGLCTQASLY